MNNVFLDRAEALMQLGTIQDQDGHFHWVGNPDRHGRHRFLVPRPRDQHLERADDGLPRKLLEVHPVYRKAEHSQHRHYDSPNEFEQRETLDQHMEENSWWKGDTQHEHIMWTLHTTQETLRRVIDSDGGSFSHHPQGHGHGVHHRNIILPPHHIEHQHGPYGHDNHRRCLQPRGGLGLLHLRGAGVGGSYDGGHPARGRVDNPFAGQPDEEIE